MYVLLWLLPPPVLGVATVFPASSFTVHLDILTLVFSPFVRCDVSRVQEVRKPRWNSVSVVYRYRCRDGRDTVSGVFVERVALEPWVPMCTLC